MEYYGVFVAIGFIRQRAPTPPIVRLPTPDYTSSRQSPPELNGGSFLREIVESAALCVRIPHGVEL